MATIYYTDGTTKEVQPKNGTDFQLDELKAIVEGYIEVLRLKDTRFIMVINEEGRVNGLSRNELATQVAELPTLEELKENIALLRSMGHSVIDATMGQEQFIAGNALVCRTEEVQ